MMSEIPSVFEVFFDGKCPLCRREIDMIRRKDKQELLILTDISDQHFVPDQFSLTQLMKEIHGRKSDGTYVKGVDVFREIYRRIGFGWLVRLSQLPLIMNVLDWCYLVFAKIRYASAKRRIARCGEVCFPTEKKNPPSGTSHNVLP